ncbi:MAG: ribokinase [Armatimonadota bacterium]
MKVLVVGNATVDRSFRIPRLPMAGETLLADSAEVDVGGKGANQAVAAARTGARVFLCAALGTDPDGTNIRGRLAAEGLDLRFLFERTGGTDTSIIYLLPSGENVIVSSHAMAASLTAQDAALALEELQAGDVLLMQGNLSVETTRCCLQAARARGACAVLNPAPIQDGYAELWPYIDALVVNEVESATLTETAEPARAARTLLSRGVGTVITTLGAKGAMVADPQQVATIAAEAVEAVDTTGAGDVVCGVIAGGLAVGLSVSAAAQLGVRAATLSVTRRGTLRAFPTRRELSVLAKDL